MNKTIPAQVNESGEKALRIRRGVSLTSAVLCLFVVLIHLTSEPVGRLAAYSVWHMVVFAINKSLCFAVPLFLFLSGFKLYGRYGAEPMEVGRFYLGRLRKIVLPYILSVLVYFAYFYIKAWVLLSDLPEYLFLGTLVAHFYYVVVAVQLYLLFPLLRFAVHRYPRLSLVLSFLITAGLRLFVAFPYMDRFFAPYLLYFLVGMVASRMGWGKKTRKLPWILPLSALLVGILHICLSYGQSVGSTPYRLSELINIGYVLLAGATVFCLCTKQDPSPRLWRVVSPLDHASYTVYLYHILLIFVLQYDILPYVTASVGLRFALSAVTVYGGIAVFAWVRNRIKRKKA